MCQKTAAKVRKTKDEIITNFKVTSLNSKELLVLTN